MTTKQDLSKLPTFKLRAMAAHASGAELRAIIAELTKRGVNVTAHW